MKTPKRYTKILFALFAASIAFSIAAGTALCADAKGDKRNGDDTSAVFSPGYINAAKQQTQNILNQGPSKNGVWQNAVEYVKSRLSRQIKEEADNDVKPDLQMRRSAEESQNKGSLASGNISQGGPNAYMDPNRAAKMLSDAVNKGASTTALSNGNIVNVWQADGKYYLNIADSEGHSMLDSIEIKGESGADWFYVNGVTDLGNGRFVLNTNSGTWNSSSSNNVYSSDGRYVQTLTIYDASGTMEEFKDYVSTYNYYYNNNNKAYKYNYDSTYLNYLTSLGDGTMVAAFNSYEYHYEGVGSTYNYSYNDENSFRILSADLSTIDEYSFNNEYYDPATGSYQYRWINGIASLGDKKFVVSTSEYSYDGTSYTDGTRFTLMDGNDFDYTKELGDYDSVFIKNSWSYDELTSTYNSDYRYVTNLISAGDGRIAVGWQTYDGTWNYSTGAYEYNDLLQLQFIDLKTKNDGTYYLDSSSPAEILGDAYNYYYDGHSYSYNYNYISEMRALEDGSVVVAINGGSGYYNYDTGESRWGTDANLKVIGSDGGLKDINTGSLSETINKSISQITSLGGGTFGFVLYEEGYNSDGQYVNEKSAEQFSSSGLDLSNLTSLSLNQNNSAYTLSSEPYSLYNNSASSNLTQQDKSEGTKTGDSKIEAALLKEGALDASYELSDSITQEDLLTILGNSLAGGNAISAYSIFGENNGYLNIMTALSNILNNPTEDQKKIIDTITGLLSDIDKTRKEEGNAELFKEEADQLIKAAAAALLAQAMPDLLTGQQISDIKGIFSALGVEKDSIVKQYEEGSQPYYDQLLKDIAKNIDILQLKNIISKELTKDDLNRMPRNKIDKIIERLKKEQKRSFEEDYILQQEVKYRSKYIEPNKKTFDERMKKLLKDFTEKINKSLETTTQKKK